MLFENETIDSDGDEAAASNASSYSAESPPVQFIIEGVFSTPLAIFGLLGNIVAIKVLSSKDLDMLPTFRHLLKMLAGFDATFLVFAFFTFCLSALSGGYAAQVKPWILPYALPIIQIALTGSVWTTMAVR